MLRKEYKKGVGLTYHIPYSKVLDYLIHGNTVKPTPYRCGRLDF